jgi:pimeloyl-ACP methyl ester carboxylesterase
MNPAKLVVIIVTVTICVTGAAEPDTVMRSVRVNGVELHYIDRGRGDSVVFVHGALDDYRMWEPELELFAQHYRVIDYSRRYNFPNENGPPGDGYSAINDAEDLAALVQELQLAPAHFVAHSYGGYATLFLAVRHPELVRSLVLAEPAAFCWARDNPEARPLFVEQMQMMWKPARELFMRGKDEEALRVALDHFEGDGFYDRLPQPSRDQLKQNLPEWHALSTSREPFPVLSEAAVARINKPVLLLTGEKTLPIFKFIDSELQRLLPKSRHVVIPNAKHEMWADNEEACRRATLEFLNVAANTTPTDGIDQKAR